jgi:hypothetical protein
MVRRRYWRRGVYLACGICLCIASVFLVRIGASYDGNCGGFLPWLAGARPCSFWEYMAGTVLLVTVVLGATYWPVILALLVLALVGVWIARRRQGDEPPA